MRTGRRLSPHSADHPIGGGGWARLDPETSTITRFPGVAGSITSEPVVDGDGRLWITTLEGAGLFRVYTGGIFPDVSTTHPFFGPIGDLVNLGIADGYADGRFRPSASVTRQATVAFLHRLVGSPEVEPSATFSDVGPTHPFRDEIRWAVAAGVVNGYSDNTFRPSAPVSRQAMAAFLQRMPAFTPDVSNVPTFSDVRTNHPFYEEIQFVAEAGIAGGYGDSTFRPSAPVTRQAMASFLVKMHLVYGPLVPLLPDPET